jgi:NAD(P)-dependent dehydrogenase (short-subunit alcohol dehydrogenase family)
MAAHVGAARASELTAALRRPSEMNDVALITGTSSGIGLASAIAFARAGFRTVATLRDPERAGALRERAAAEGVVLGVRALDVAKPDSVASCVAGVLRELGRIDVLVNNAGAGFVAALEQTSEAELRRVMEVNFFGVWRTTQAVLPAMRAAGRGRIVSVTSVGGLFGQPFNDAYCAAKFAVEGAMEALAPVAARFGVRVALVEPGPVNTEFVASVMRNSPVATATTRDAYSDLIARYRASTASTFATLGQSGDDVARVILEAATAEAPHFRYVTSEFVRGLAAQKFVDPTGDSILAIFGARLA